MRQKVQKLTDAIHDLIAGWDGVTAVTLGDTLEKDLYDPYFFIRYDVYFTDTLPSFAERQETLSFVQAYETSSCGMKDRFLADGLPVRIEYRNTAKVEKLLDAAVAGGEAFCDSSTYGLFRLKDFNILTDSTNWLKTCREKMEKLPDSFYSVIARRQVASLEHVVSDMGAAIVKEDELFFHISMGRFLEYTLETLYSLNKKLDPGPRARAVDHLTSLPESFRTRLEILIQDQSSFSPRQKFEIAELVATSLYNMASF